MILGFPGTGKTYVIKELLPEFLKKELSINWYVEESPLLKAAYQIIAINKLVVYLKATDLVDECELRGYDFATSVLACLTEYARRGHCVIAIDEIDSLAKIRTSLDRYSLVGNILNLVESARAPCLIIFLTNSPELVDPAVISRVTYILVVRETPASYVRMFLKKVLEDHGLSEREAFDMAYRIIATISKLFKKEGRCYNMRIFRNVLIEKLVKEGIDTRFLSDLISRIREAPHNSALLKGKEQILSLKQRIVLYGVKLTLSELVRSVKSGHLSQEIFEEIISYFIANRGLFPLEEDIRKWANDHIDFVEKDDTDTLLRAFMMRKLLLWNSRYQKSRFKFPNS